MLSFHESLSHLVITSGEPDGLHWCSRMSFCSCVSIMETWRESVSENEGVFEQKDNTSFINHSLYIFSPPGLYCSMLRQGTPVTSDGEYGLISINNRCEAVIT